jgi:microsomal dipeptidase-like Zn-dependent dipeptidase
LLDKLGEDSVGIGSDLDGGLTPKNTPEGVNTVADLRLIEEELARRDVAEDTIRKVMGENWFRFLQWHLPAGASPPP